MKKTIITVISLLIGLIIVIYAYEFIFKKPVIESPIIDENSFPAQKVEIKEQYKDSMYTFAGSIDVPTPCHSLTTTLNKLSDVQYEIQIRTIDPPEDVVCAQVITSKPYKISFEGLEDIEVTINIDGIIYQTNRFVVPSDQNIDSFILEVKG
jgi:hypothetical protein